METVLSNVSCMALMCRAVRSKITETTIACVCYTRIFILHPNLLKAQIRRLNVRWSGYLYNRCNIRGMTNFFSKKSWWKLMMLRNPLSQIGYGADVCVSECAFPTIYMHMSLTPRLDYPCALSVCSSNATESAS
jgi:hypothetical protein